MVPFWRLAVPHLVLASLLTAPIAVVGCAEHAQDRVYDPDDGTYHYWNDAEVSHYHQWEDETHRSDRDYRNRNNEEQREYWQWRTNHPDNDRRDQGDHDDHY